MTARTEEKEQNRSSQGISNRKQCSGADKTKTGRRGKKKKETGMSSCSWDVTSPSKGCRPAGRLSPVLRYRRVLVYARLCEKGKVCSHCDWISPRCVWRTHVSPEDDVPTLRRLRPPPRNPTSKLGRWKHHDMAAHTIADSEARTTTLEASVHGMWHSVTTQHGSVTVFWMRKWLGLN